ncbi:MAG TPA: dipeptide epimerase [Candidatus Polarisedimenticolia bacterium]|nr:dipeptide epimerase [Candidatus Polarisedimenticolia bacterium]
MTRKDFLGLSARALAAATFFAAGSPPPSATGATPRRGKARPPADRDGAAPGSARRGGRPPIRLERRKVELALRHTWTIARNSSAAKTNVLTRLSCGGIEGLGEAAPNVRYGEDWETVLTGLDLLAPRLGDDPTAYESVIDRMHKVLDGNHAAKAAIDIALHDWVGRKEKVPLCVKFGADPAKAPLTSMSIGIDEIPAMQEKVREAADFRILKIKVGLENDREILEGIRKVTDKPLYVDANEGWKDPKRAVEMIKWMEGLGVVLLEQPLPAADLDGAKYVRDRVDMPIFADEAVLTVDDIEPLASAFDGINVKLQKSGGLRMARLMIDRARALKMKVMLGCMIETSIGITAAAHLSPLVDHADLDGNLLIANDPFRGVVVRDGRLVLPDRPGLGVEGSW